MAYPRLVRRIIKSRRYRFKNFRAFKRTGRRARSNRIFRRFIRRTARRPELKWIQQSSYVGSNFFSLNPYTTNITPTLMAPGTGHDNRVGNEINLVKVDWCFGFREEADGSTQVYNSSIVRFFMWTPRVDLADAQTYVASLTGVNYLTQLDFDILTVHLDRTFNLGQNYIQTAALSTAMSAGLPDTQVKKGSLKFPRKVKFTNIGTFDQLDDEKDVLYVTCLTSNNNGGVNLYWSAKTWFYDA